MRRRASAGLLALAGLLTACNPVAHAFRADRSLDITSPAAATEVRLPLTVRWQVSDFTATGLDGRHASRAGAFALFVDRSPMPVGKTLAWFGRDDPSCQRPAGCTDQSYLAGKSVYVGTATTRTLTSLPAAKDQVGDEQHDVTIVLLDGQGRRTGENSWYRTFRTPRRSS